MGFKDRITDLMPDRSDLDQDDSLEQRKLVGYGINWENVDPYEEFDEISGEDVAEVITDMTQDDRVDLTIDPRFIEHHWESVESAIDENQELQSKFGQDGLQVDWIDGGTVCINHEDQTPEVIDRHCTAMIQKSSGEKQTETRSKNANLDAGLNALAANIGTNAGAKTGEKMSTNIQYTEARGSITMETCRGDRDNCTTSKMGFYYTARSMSKMRVRNSDVFYGEVSNEAFVERYPSSREAINELQDRAEIEAISDQIEPLQEEIEQIEEENETLEETISDYEQRKEELIDYKEDIETYIDQLSEEKHSVRINNHELTQKELEHRKESDQNDEEITEEIEENHQQIDELEETIEEKTQTKTDLEEEISEFDSKINSAQEDQAANERQISELESRIETIKSDSKETEYMSTEAAAQTSRETRSAGDGATTADETTTDEQAEVTLSEGEIGEWLANNPPPNSEETQSTESQKTEKGSSI